MLNQVVLIGKVVGFESDSKNSHYLLLAVERDFKDFEGKFRIDVIRCVLWKGISESVKNYYKEGQLISICGRLEENENMPNLVIAEKLSFVGRTTKGEFVKE